MNKILKDYFDVMSKEQRISHAFLLCDTFYDNLKDDLEELFSDYFFNFRINIEENSDVYLIRPSNDKILKKDILDLQEEFKHFSQINENRIYIIDNAEKMNDEAANSLLKFLEEPEKNIYAFLLTTNINKVMPTIKSRCQILKIQNYSVFNICDYEEEFLDNVISFLVDLESKKVKMLAYIYKYIGKKEEKENIQKILKIFKYFYRDILNYLFFNEVVYFDKYRDKIDIVISCNSEKTLISKLMILNKNENMLEYNLNLGLFMDKLIIEMGRVCDE